MTLTVKGIEAKVVEEHAVAAGKLHWCNYVVGYVGNSDDTTEVFLNPPALVIISKDDYGLLHNTGTHIDPYWDLSQAIPDERLDNLRSIFTFGPSYHLESGELEEGEKCIWPAELTYWQRVVWYWTKIYWR